MKFTEEVMKKRINSKNFDKWKIIDIIAPIIIYILSMLSTMLSNSAKEEMKYILSSNNTLLYIISLIIYSLPSFLFYLALYLGIRYPIKKLEKKNLTYNANKDILYYRDILKDLTPFEISILANLNIEEKKDIVATILWYQQKNYIDIKNEQIIFNSDVKLNKKDELFLNFLKTNDYGYLESYKNISYKDLKEKKYIVENKYKLNIAKNIILIFGLFIITIVLILLNIFFVKNMIIQKTIDLLLIVIIFFIIYKKIASIVTSYINKTNNFRRTKLGEEKITYIHALQNFIHDFSNLKDYNKEQILLWEDFLIYAIVLEQNDKIIEDITKLFKNKYFNDNINQISHLIKKYII